MYPSLYEQQRNYKKKQKKQCLRSEGYISPLCSSYPRKALVNLTHGACGVLWAM